MDAGQWLIIGVCIVLGLWFVAGTITNVRKVRTISKALQTALPKYGTVSAYRRLGNSGAQFIVEKAEAPFRQIEMVFLLEPRENLLLWLFERIRGRRDELMLRANLRNAPAQEIRLGRREDRQFKASVLKEQGKPYEWIEAPAGLEVARRGATDTPMIKRLGKLMDRYGEAVRRVSIQPKEPHLTVRVRLSAEGEKSAATLLEAVGETLQSSSPG
jgi:hypothetical protein